MSRLWINGHLIDKADARVSPFDHGFLYGDGVWDHLRVFGGKLFRPEYPCHYLKIAAGLLGITIPLSQPELIAAIETTVRANNRTEGYVRVIVTRGPGTLGPDPRKIDPQVFIIAEEYYPFPVELYDHGLHVVTAPVRIDLSHPILMARLLGRPPLALAKQHALQNGCLEAVLLHSNGQVAAGTEGSLFLVQDGKVRYLSHWPLDVAWQEVIELAQKAEIEGGLHTGARPDDLLAAGEVFLAGTSCGVIGIVRIDGKDVGGGTEGPVTRAIRERYRVLTRGE
jgi:branched-chain amino acid aminotransferase